MKKSVLLLALLGVAFSSKADKLPTRWFETPHIEFKYYGFYGVVDYTFMTNFKHEEDGYMDQTGVVHTYIDKYTLNGITAVAGWQWRKESGIGLGFSYLNDGTGSFSQIPVFVEFRSHYLRSRITPFSVVQLGYSIPFGSKNSDEEYTRIDEGGITFGFSAGARYAIKPKLGVNVYVGYQMIQINSVERGFAEVAHTKMPNLYHNIKFGLGVNF